MLNDAQALFERIWPIFAKLATLLILRSLITKNDFFCLPNIFPPTELCIMMKKIKENQMLAMMPPPSLEILMKSTLTSSTMKKQKLQQKSRNHEEKKEKGQEKADVVVNDVGPYSTHP